MLAVVEQIIMIFLLMGVGLYLRVSKVFSDTVIKGVNTLLINIAWPMLMISVTQTEYTNETLGTFLYILFGAVIILTLTLVGVYLFYRRRQKPLAPMLAMLGCMPNAGYFGIPIISALYGDIGLLYLAAYIIGFNLVLWSVGIALYTGFDAKALRNLINPGIVAALIGIALFLMKIELPTPLLSAVRQLANLNTPLAMIILGSRMDTLRPEMLKDMRSWQIILFKLILQPLIALTLFKLAGAAGMALVILTLCTAMPAAAATQLMTERYGGDVYFTAKTTALGTLCTLFSMPVMLYIASLFA